MSNGRRTLTRRSVFSLAVASAAGNLPRLSAAGGYRSVVVIQLFGGNDSNNMLVPLDPVPYAAYAQTRKQLALNSKSLLAVTTLQRSGSYGFHGSMGEISRIYKTGQLAVVANTGAPQCPALGAQEMFSYVKGGFVMPSWAGAGDIRDGRAIGFSQTGVTVMPLDAAAASSPQWRVAMAKAQAAWLRTQFPNTGLGQAMKHIAGMIQTQMGPAVYLTTLGGFATTVNQLQTHSALLGTLSAAMGAFYNATLELGVANRVTTVTDSEYGRSLYPNQTNGSDAGWGAHHLVMGAAVQGGQIVGTFPYLAAGSQLNSSGGLVPTTPRDRLETTLNSWLRGTSSPASMGFLA